MPPIAKLKIKLSMSKPVFKARLNKEGGLQYSGTNKGSVSPNGIVRTLTISISFLPLLKINTIIQITNKIKEKTNHSFKIVMVSYYFIELYIFAKSQPIIQPKIIASITPNKPFPTDTDSTAILLMSMP